MERPGPQAPGSRAPAAALDGAVPPESPSQYNYRFDLEMSKMTVDQVIRWNPHFTPDQAAEQIAQAKQAVALANETPLKAEINDRLLNGSRQLTIGQLNDAVRAIGYKFDRLNDCRSVARWITGHRAGCTYPVCMLYIVQCDDGKSAFHVEARRDEKFEALQALRGTIFAVSRNALVEF